MLPFYKKEKSAGEHLALGHAEVGTNPSGLVLKSIPSEGVCLLLYAELLFNQQV